MHPGRRPFGAPRGQVELQVTASVVDVARIARRILDNQLRMRTEVGISIAPGLDVSIRGLDRDNAIGDIEDAVWLPIEISKPVTGIYFRLLFAMLNQKPDRCEVGLVHSAVHCEGHP